ncbi:unnamed protein product [Mytilus edulis]|uniref:TRIM56 n=1 Tax=Mytilus edulis TaxID=6550 RepID=A0A8S3SG97_MYTED|nr:unnamed protein product [Mytilus edulis]
MAQGKYSDIESKCGICLSPYTEPRLLDCFHTFCTPCLEKLDVNDSYLTCPLCRTKISISDKGVSGLKSYPFNFERSQSDNELTDICEFCFDENIAVAKCLDCKINLCTNCRDYHKKIKTSHSHSLEKLKLEQLDTHNDNSAHECKEHKRSLLYFCKPCNILLCSECSEKAHRFHDFQNLAILIQAKKKMLLARTASLKSRISVLGNTTERIKQEENNSYKHCSIVKKDMIVHATSIKDVFCNTVDILMNQNLAIIDNVKKKDVKAIDTYLNEIETEQLSLAGLVKTTEDFITRSSEKQFMEDFYIIGRHLDKVLNKTVNPLNLHELKYKSGEFKKATIEQLFGQINVCAKDNVVTPLYPELPMPEFLPVKERHSFKFPHKIIDIATANNDNMWIFTENLVSLCNHNGVVQSTYAPIAESKRMLRKSADELWFWTGQSAVKKVKTNHLEGYKVPFKNGLVGCFIRNGNLLVYNKDEKEFYEVSEQKGVQQKIKIVDPKNKLKNTDIFTGENILMTETKNSNLVISSPNKTVVIADKHGTILEAFERPNAIFQRYSCR